MCVSLLGKKIVASCMAAAVGCFFGWSDDFDLVANLGTIRVPTSRKATALTSRLDDLQRLCLHHTRSFAPREVEVLH